MLCFEPQSEVNMHAIVRTKNVKPQSCGDASILMQLLHILDQFLRGLIKAPLHQWPHLFIQSQTCKTSLQNTGHVPLS